MGACSADGHAIVAALHDAGARVAAVRDVSQPTAAVPGAAAEFDGDLTTEGDVHRIAAEVTQKLGPPDILVNALQVPYSKAFLETPLVAWERAFAINVTAPALACRCIGEGMVERGAGKIVNLASGMGARGLPNSVTFAATQGAVMQLTAALAIEWAPHGVKVNAAAPVWLESGDPAEDEATLQKYIPFRRRGTVDELANLVLFLCCDGAHFLTGKTVFLDGAVLSHA